MGENATDRHVRDRPADLRGDGAQRQVHQPAMRTARYRRGSPLLLVGLGA
jgi:hypothetical protein